MKARQESLAAMASTAALLVLTLAPTLTTHAQVCNLKVVTDANPDYQDVQSMVHSITDCRFRARS